ncbi:MAG: fused MFS/spermidine synthase, partial [Bacteroidia bacterium]
MQRKFLFLSFIEGAAVMAAELCGAKLLSPIFGSSLYVWASVMGITLAALALGYFYGGMVTERSKDHSKKLFRILISASLFLVLMPLLSYYLVPRISYLPFLPAVVISTGCLLFFPVFFLGASSPLFIVLQTNSANSAGKVSGSVYAISTFGGILATFLCGFWLIPFAGLNITILIFGTLLFFFTVLIFKTTKVTSLLLFSGFVYLNLQFELKKVPVIMSSDSVLGHLEVKDIVSNHHRVRLLQINNIIQTEMDLISKHSVSGYVRLLDTLIHPSCSRGQALVLGLGGGLTANLLAEKNYNVTGVEFDDRIIEASRYYFSLNKNVETVCGDARYYLNNCKKKYDLVLVDVFKAEEQPSHVITTQSLEQLKNNLSNNAVIYINWHGYTSEVLGKGTSILYNTLVSCGFQVKLTSLSDDENYRNIIFVASLNKEILSSLNRGLILPDKLVSTDQVNTDDKPALEKFNARANKTW